MIAILAKNDAKHLPRFLETMSKLDYPKNKLKWVWMYGKSIDSTLDLILEFHKKNPEYKYEVYEEPVFHNPTRSAMYIAVPCNEFRKLLTDEDFVLMVDTDIGVLPPETLQVLIKQGKDIIAPYPYIENSNPRQFYDTYVFRYANQRFENLVIDGKKYNAWNPPFENEKQPIQLDSVGTCWLTKANVFKEIAFDNPAPAYQFCKNARKAGYTVWTLPSLQIEHINIIGQEQPHFPLEWYVARGILPKEELGKLQG